MPICVLYVNYCNPFIHLLVDDHPSLLHLNNHVVSYVATKWKDLGEILLHPDIVDTQCLEIIEKDNPGNVKACCNSMFKKWLDTDTNASWKKLIKALQQPSIQLHYRAEQIRKKLKSRANIYVGYLIDNWYIILMYVKVKRKLYL